MRSVAHVILTEGVGSRLYSLSKKSKTKPKQYFEIFENKSLFEMILKRNQNLVVTVIVVGNCNNKHLTRELLNKSNTSYLDVVQATLRNTVGAIVFIASVSCSDDILIVTPSGHPIDENGNIVIGTEIYSTFIEFQNTIFVCTDTANLILQKENSQDVKSIYNTLEKQNSYLLN